MSPQITNLIAQRIKGKPSYLRVIFDMAELVKMRPVVGCVGNDRIGYLIRWDQDLEELTFEPVNMTKSKNRRTAEVLALLNGIMTTSTIYLPQPTPGKSWSSHQYSVDVFLGSKAVDTILGPFNVGRFDPATIENKCCGVFTVDVYPS